MRLIQFHEVPYLVRHAGLDRLIDLQAGELKRTCISCAVVQRSVLRIERFDIEQGAISIPDHQYEIGSKRDCRCASVRTGPGTRNDVSFGTPTSVATGSAARVARECVRWFGISVPAALARSLAITPRPCPVPQYVERVACAFASDALHRNRRRHVDSAGSPRPTRTTLVLR